MLRRRHLAAALAAGLAAAERAKLALIILPSRAPVPGGVRFSRAYAACPAASALRSSIVTGRFPHAGAGQPLLSIAETESPQSPALFISRPRDDAPFERSTHLVMMLRHRRLAGGEPVDAPVSTVDIAPTLYGLAGLPAPRDVHGRDLSELLLTGRGDRPESVYAEGGLNTADEWRMVVRGLDKIVVRPNLEVLHLFNLGEDPGEERDLARETGYRLRVDEMTALVRIWMRRTGDGVEPSGLKRR